MTEGPLYGKWPGEVASYDGPTRTIRVRIPSVTDGSNVLPIAVLEYPIGDRADAPNSKDRTEIRILAGDPVWIEFECGDPRFPIITGYRLKREGNPTNWRRWRHANIELTADNEMVINAAKLTFNISGDVVEHVGGSHKSDVGGALEATAATSKLTSATHILTAQTQIAGALTTTAGAGGGVGATIQGPVSIIGGTVTHNSKSIGSNHTHSGVQTGTGSTGAPN